MQIHAADTSLGQFIIRPFNNKEQTKFQNPFAPANYQGSLSLSELGGRLCVDGKAVLSWEDKVTRGGDDKTLRLIDESISQVGGILEQMKKVANLAQDESLFDVDRIDLQIKMERLQRDGARVYGNDEYDNYNGLRVSRRSRGINGQKTERAHKAAQSAR
jgi:hypothetical protein